MSVWWGSGDRMDRPGDGTRSLSDPAPWRSRGRVGLLTGVVGGQRSLVRPGGGRARAGGGWEGQVVVSATVARVAEGWGPEVVLAGRAVGRRV